VPAPAAGSWSPGLTRVAGALLLLRLSLPGAGAKRKKLHDDKVAWADAAAGAPFRPRASADAILCARRRHPSCAVPSPCHHRVHTLPRTRLPPRERPGTRVVGEAGGARAGDDGGEEEAEAGEEEEAEAGEGDEAEEGEAAAEEEADAGEDEEAAEGSAEAGAGDAAAAGGGKGAA
jgi:hypothetical protein